MFGVFLHLSEFQKHFRHLLRIRLCIFYRFPVCFLRFVPKNGDKNGDKSGDAAARFARPLRIKLART